MTIPWCGLPWGFSLMGRPKFNPWVGKMPWRRERQPTPIFLPGEFHRQRSLAGYSPQGRKESDTAEQLTRAHTHIYHGVLLHSPVDGYSSCLQFLPITSKATTQDFPGVTVVKNPPANAGDIGSTPGPGRFHTPQSS